MSERLFVPEDFLRTGGLLSDAEIDEELDRLSEEDLWEVRGRRASDFYASIMIQGKTKDFYLELMSKRELPIRLPIVFSEGADVGKTIGEVFDHPLNFALSMGIHPQILYYQQRQVA